jgi:hypothetical protein
MKRQTPGKQQRQLIFGSSLTLIHEALRLQIIEVCMADEDFATYLPIFLAAVADEFHIASTTAACGLEGCLAPIAL